MMPGKNNHHF